MDALETKYNNSLCVGSGNEIEIKLLADTLK
jgi:hypothetical protein